MRIICLIVTFLIVVSYFIWDNSYLFGNPKEVTFGGETRLLSDEESIQEADISAWKVYKNKEYGFQMKIPKNWNWRVIEPHESQRSGDALHSYGEIVLLDFPSPGGIEFYEINGDKERRCFILQGFYNDKKWSLRKFWVIHSSDVTDNDFDGEIYVGDPEFYPSGFLHDSCDNCSVPFYEFVEDPFYSAEISTIVDLNGKLFIKFYQGGGKIVQDIVSTITSL